jgi:uncharacterized protein (DUF433 family)
MDETMQHGMEVDGNCHCGRPQCASHYRYLVARQHAWRRQLAFKNRRLAVGVFLGRMRAERWTAEEAAAQFDLPVEAVFEAIEYGDGHVPLIAAEIAEDARAARRAGRTHDVPIRRGKEGGPAPVHGKR